MTKRLFDIAFSITLLVLTLPLFVFAAVGIKLTSSGPVFYRCARIGLNGIPFKMFKFRSMTVGRQTTVITGASEPRIFWFGNLLRHAKIDELPQLYNVLRGDMSVVGPRPEDPKIVADHYSDWMLETLQTSPGLTGPGSVYYYKYGERFLKNADVEQAYVANLLGPKLAIEHTYMQRATLRSDIWIIAQTLFVILQCQSGRSENSPISTQTK